MKITYPKHHIIIIGKPLISLQEFGLDCCPQNTLWTSDRFLPNALVDLGIIESKAEVRKNRKELIKNCEKADWFTLKFGHRIVDVVVGE